MIRLSNHLLGQWVDGGPTAAVLVNPATEEPIAELAGGAEAKIAEALDFARRTGGPALRELTFRQRGDLLRRASKALHDRRDELLALAIENGGGTRSDAKFDVDGAIGTLAHYAELAETLGDGRVLADGDGVQLSRSPRFYGRHLLSPRAGVAVHINAFNFPAWGPMEKAACALLAGMPVLTKPASATALVTHRMTEILVEANVFPAGAFQLLLGPVGDLFDRLGGQDVVAFTGSSETGAKIRRHERLVSENVRVNVEADSLNAAVLGPDVEPGSPTWNLFVGDVVRDMTQKTGQKCTAIRRVLVPAATLDRVREAMADRLANVRVGNPALEEVTMGPLATASQLRDVRAGIARLAAEAEPVFGDAGAVRPIGVPPGKGFFVGPVLLLCARPESAAAIHAHEVFGPVATLLPYEGSARAAAELVQKGGGGLVASAYSDDRAFLGDLVLALAPWHGRLYLGSEKIADKSPGPGTVLPQLVHGGPGRAGAGEELGGLRGMMLYLQRTALEGDKAILEAIVR